MSEEVVLKLSKDEASWLMRHCVTNVEMGITILNQLNQAGKLQQAGQHIKMLKYFRDILKRLDDMGVKP